MIFNTFTFGEPGNNAIDEDISSEKKHSEKESEKDDEESLKIDADTAKKIEKAATEIVNGNPENDGLF